MLFERLPVDLIAEILGKLDLESLIQMSYVSKRFYLVASEPSLNPWRQPIMRNLRSHSYDPALKHLSVRLTVPRQNWIDILAAAMPSFILFDATLPNLRAAEWEECFKRRFLPSWEKWKKETSWKETYLKVLHRVWHRSVTSCTTDEAWTKYIVLNRSGTANELEMSSRNYNPLTIFNEMKLQNNLSHLETRIRLVLELSDVRILAFGVLVKPRSDFNVNPNAHIFLNPPGITPDRNDRNALSKITSKNNSSGLIDDHGVYPRSTSMVPSVLFKEYRNPSTTYRRLTHPEPAPTHVNYPFFTSGGGDLRWLDLGEMEEKDLHWVGGLLITAQLIGASRDTDNILYGRHQYASFGWQDLWAIAPWMEDTITKRINGAGLGN